MDKSNSGNRGGLTVRLQCRLLMINRSNIYYRPRNVEEIGNLCNQIYELWQKYPFFGYRRITAILNEQSNNLKINHKRILRLMRLIGIKAIYSKKKTTIINKRDYKYPYLLKSLTINKSNQVWSTDITYIKTPVGFVYLIALIDWYSRFIISWKLSINMATESCIDILTKGVRNYQAPKIINSDQGSSQFTGNNWLEELKKRNIQISMDGKGRWLDNVRIERFWRTIKHEQIYLNPPDNLEELKRGIAKFIKFYNYQRPHQSLSYKTPSQIYYGDDAKRKAIRF